VRRHRLDTVDNILREQVREARLWVSAAGVVASFALGTESSQPIPRQLIELRPPKEGLVSGGGCASNLFPDRIVPLRADCHLPVGPRQIGKDVPRGRGQIRLERTDELQVLRPEPPRNVPPFQQAHFPRQGLDPGVQDAVNPGFHTAGASAGADLLRHTGTIASHPKPDNGLL